MLAGLTSVPVAPAATVPVTVYVIELPKGKVTVSVSVLPEPVGVESVAPPLATEVQVAPVKLAGSGSLTIALVIVPACVPVLLTTIVYVSDWPPTTVPTAPVILDPPALSTLVIVITLSLSVAVAVVGVPFGGKAWMLAGLTSVPVAPAATVPVTVYVIELPNGNVTVSVSVLPEPVGVESVAPPLATDVQVAPIKLAGNGSLTIALVIVPPW